jgi:GNAT superfamily N-acetyltransferase
MELSIREVVPEDEPIIIGLYRRSQAHSRIPDPVAFPPETLGADLHSRHPIKQYVAIASGEVIGHGMIEAAADPTSIEIWRRVMREANDRPFIELGAAFVDPNWTGNGIYSKLLEHRLHVVRAMGAVPVSATWEQNLHVMGAFRRRGGIEAGIQLVAAGQLHLFVFQLQ